MFLFRGRPVHCKFIQINSAAQIISALQKEINTDEYINSNIDILDAAYINGDDISDSIIETINDKTSINFVKFNPFEKLPYNPELIKNKNFTDNFNSYSAAAGIAYRLA